MKVSRHDDEESSIQQCLSSFNFIFYLNSRSGSTTGYFECTGKYYMKCKKTNCDIVHPLDTD